MEAGTAIAIFWVNAGWATPLTLLAGLLLAITIGALRGWLIVSDQDTEIPPLLATLASGPAVLVLVWS